MRLAAGSGVVTELSLAQLLMSEGFEVVSAPAPPPLPPSTLLEGMPEAVAAEALWWDGTSWRCCAGFRRRPRRGPGRNRSMTRRWCR